jgi:CRISPR/Cas system CSM-associated protein Csm3 (group 7 of RAMP superfamily)
MFGNRIEFICDLEALSPIHAGTGEFAELSIGRRNEPVSYAEVQRDARQQPFLAGSGLKGAIRAYAQRSAASPDELEVLFGAIDSQQGAGRMAGLVVYGASAVSHGQVSGELPYAPELNKSAAYVAARTAVNSASGVAKDHQLFFQEMVEAGTRFQFRALLLSHGRLGVALAERIFAGLMRDGLSLGKSRADGQGRVRFDKVRLVEWEISVTGDLKVARERSLTPSGGEANAATTIRLHCGGPFLVQDSSHSARAVPGKDSGEPQIQAQRSSVHTPLLPGTSVAGALKNRATWLWRRDRLRGNAPLAQAPGADPIIRLFGTAGAMALLHIQECDVAKAAPFDITSVKLDRFTGGPVDNALFTTSAFTGVTLHLGLKLVARPGFEPDVWDRYLFETLCADIKKNGLDLGAGSSKGFGWFQGGGA